MPKLLSFFLAALLLSSCSSMPQSAAGDNPEYFTALSEDQANAELKKVLTDIEEVDEDIRSAEARRDSARMKQGSDESLDTATEGAEADLDTLQARKGALINRQVQLEKRLRDFQVNKY
jgi:hypothetical protein